MATTAMLSRLSATLPGPSPFRNSSSALRHLAVNRRLQEGKFLTKDFKNGSVNRNSSKSAQNLVLTSNKINLGEPHDIPEVERVDALRADDARKAVTRVRVDAEKLLQRLREAVIRLEAFRILNGCQTLTGMPDKKHITSSNSQVTDRPVYCTGLGKIVVPRLRES